MTRRIRAGRRIALATLAFAAAGCGGGESVGGQELHAAKGAYADAQSWPATSAADVSLPNFRPFRAIYERHYSQGLGPSAGEPRQDWVVVTADYAAWDDREAIVVSMYDTGNNAYSDTNGRIWTAYVDRTNLDLLLELGPLPGAAKDYYVLRRSDDGLVGGMMNLDEQNTEYQTAPVGEAMGIAIGPWAMASVPLAAGDRLRFDPFFGITANAFGSTPAIVDGRVSFEDPTGQLWDAWQIDQMGSPSSPRVSRTVVMQEPPYLVARYLHNLETEEDSPGQRLVALQFLDSAPTTPTTAGR